jgi:intracellular multiplication protein IcmC
MELLVGSVLIYLPSSTDLMLNSLFNTGTTLFGGSATFNYQNLGEGASILNYGNTSSFDAQWAALANTLVLYCQFFGFLSFVRGWFILSKSAGQGAQPGSFGKAMAHIIGGALLINLIEVTELIRNTIT